MKKLFLKITEKTEEMILLDKSTFKKPGKLFQIINKFPLGLYRIGLGGLVVGPFLRITTVGRVSGKPRHTMLEFTLYPNSQDPIIMSGWSGRSDWVKNIMKNPSVEVRMGWKCFSANAEKLSDEIVAERLDEYFKVMPRMKQVLETRVGFKLDGSREKLLEMARLHPSFRLKRV